MRKLLFLFSVIASMPIVTHADWTNGTVATTISNTNGSKQTEFYVYVRGTQDISQGAPPACATTTKGETPRYVFDVSTASGKTAAAQILMAQATGKQVLVVGLGNCNVASDTESVMYVQVNK